MGDDEAVGAIGGGAVLGQDRQITEPDPLLRVLGVCVGGLEFVEAEVEFVAQVSVLTAAVRWRQARGGRAGAGPLYMRR